MFSKKPDNKLNERTPLFNATENAKPILSSKSNDDAMQEVSKALEKDLEIAQTLLNDLRGRQQFNSQINNHVELALLQNSAFLKKYNLYTLANQYKDVYKELTYTSAHESTAQKSEQQLKDVVNKYIERLENVPETIKAMKEGIEAVKSKNNSRHNTIR